MYPEKRQFQQTNWQYKGLRILREIGTDDDTLYVYQHGNLYPIDKNLPTTIQADYEASIHSFSIHGKIGQNQE